MQETTHLWTIAEGFILKFLTGETLCITAS